MWSALVSTPRRCSLVCVIPAPFQLPHMEGLVAHPTDPTCLAGHMSSQTGGVSRVGNQPLHVGQLEGLLTMPMGEHLPDVYPANQSSSKMMWSESILYRRVVHAGKMTLTHSIRPIQCCETACHCVELKAPRTICRLLSNSQVCLPQDVWSGQLGTSKKQGWPYLCKFIYYIGPYLGISV